jgi:hypothetical protein
MLGPSVELMFISSSTTEWAYGRLQEVNNRGIVLTAEGHCEHPARPLFYPWGVIIRVSEAPEPVRGATRAP